MKTFTLLTIAALTLFATAAAAQHGGGHRGNMGNMGNMGNQVRMQQANSSGGGCPMNGMRGQAMQGNTRQGNASQTAANSNWRANPSYQGQTVQTPSGR